MNLTRSKLVEFIKEELSLLGALNPEENFIRKYGIVLSGADDEMPVSDAFRSGAEVQELESEDPKKVVKRETKETLETTEADKYNAIALLMEYYAIHVRCLERRANGTATKAWCKEQIGDAEYVRSQVEEKLEKALEILKSFKKTPLAEKKKRKKKKKKKKKRKLTKIQIIKRDKRAKKIMKSTKKKYGKERGEDIAYAIATNQVKVAEVRNANENSLSVNTH